MAHPNFSKCTDQQLEAERQRLERLIEKRHPQRSQRASQAESLRAVWREMGNRGI